MVDGKENHTLGNSKLATPEEPVILPQLRKRQSGEKGHHNGKVLKENLKRIDYILIYPNKTVEECGGENTDAYKSFMLAQKLRKVFEDHLKAKGFDMQEDDIGQNVFLKLHAPFAILCKGAEESHVEMPLKGHEIYPEEKPNLFERFENKFLVTDTEVDFVSAPYQIDRHLLFEKCDDPELFFRPSMRSFLTHHILMNLDVRNEREEKEDPFSKQGLQYMLMKKAYTDAFTLHDESSDDPELKKDAVALRAHMGSRFLLREHEEIPDNLSHTNDNRKVLSAVWAKKWFKYQPLWKIRNYFGEKIALYFAWTATLVTTLLIPTLLGIAIFIYGVTLSVEEDRLRTAEADNSTSDSNITTTTLSPAVKIADDIANLVGVLQRSFDNEATPYFSLIICLWGTIFLEVWKRKNYTLAYEWDVDNFENSEPDRPQFYGTKTATNPVVPNELRWIYPLWRKICKYALSGLVLIAMSLLVCLCVAVVVLYRVYMTVNFCSEETKTGENKNSTISCLIVSSIAASVMQAIFIVILGKVYEKISNRLTDWENHRTQTEYDDALIIKLFVFQFVNSYTSLYYIAFFRGREYPNGIFNLGPEYQDSCGSENNCMSMLSLQVLVLMIAKPLPKFLKDIVLPWIKKLWREKIKPCCQRNCSCCRKVAPLTREQTVVEQRIEDYMERERCKPPLGDFTLYEYTEKVLVYGFLMLFCVAMPLGPLIALLVTAVDIRVDARRMLWWYRRPVSQVAQDIGRWFAILQVLNIIGVVTNGFLIAYVSRWGTKYENDPEIQVWIVLIFEHLVFVSKFAIALVIPSIPQHIKLAMKRHVVFILKYILAVLIPDVPERIRLAMKRERYQVTKILQEAHLSATLHMPPRENFGKDMIKPVITTDLGAAPSSLHVQKECGSDIDQLIEDGGRHKKKKDKKHKKQKEEDAVPGITFDPLDIATSAQQPAEYHPPENQSGTQARKHAKTGKRPLASHEWPNLHTNNNNNGSESWETQATGFEVSEPVPSGSKVDVSDSGDVFTNPNSQPVVSRSYLSSTNPNYEFHSPRPYARNLSPILEYNSKNYEHFDPPPLTATNKNALILHALDKRRSKNDENTSSTHMKIFQMPRESHA